MTKAIKPGALVEFETEEGPQKGHAVKPMTDIINGRKCMDVVIKHGSESVTWTVPIADLKLAA